VTTVQDILNILTDIAADSLAEPWDNVGLLIGSPHEPVTSILLALDPTSELLTQAAQHKSELIITHHPIIFHPLKAVRQDQPSGSLVSQAILQHVHIIGCHTNFDATAGGVSDVLARALGVNSARPLVPAKSCESSCGLGRIGELTTPLTPADFISTLTRSLQPPWLLEAGPRPEKISRIAVCGGSCSDFAETALLQQADVFISAEIKHATARWAEEVGLWIIDAGHFATEAPAMAALQQMLTTRLQEEAMDINVHLAPQEPPLKLVNID